MPIEILELQICRLINKEFASVKVLWRTESVEVTIGEIEGVMKAKCPYIFPSNSVSATGNS